MAMKETRYLNFILTALTLVLALNLLLEFAKGPSWSSQAMAKEKHEVPALPDSGAQREEIIKQLKALNLKSDDMAKAVTSGEMRVRINSAVVPPQ